MTRADEFRPRTPRWCWAVTFAIAAVLLPSAGFDAHAGGDAKELMSREALLQRVEAARSQIEDLKVTFTFDSREEIPNNLFNRFKATVVVKGQKTFIDRSTSKSMTAPPYQFRRGAAH